MKLDVLSAMQFITEAWRLFLQSVVSQLIMSTAVMTVQ
jgi:hypothetical protein